MVSDSVHRLAMFLLTPLLTTVLVMFACVSVADLTGVPLGGGFPLHGRSVGKRGEGKPVLNS